MLFAHTLNRVQRVCSKQHTFLAFFLLHIHSTPLQAQRMKEAKIPKGLKGTITAVIRSASE